MDLRTLPEGLSPGERCNERRKRIEATLGVDLSLTAEHAERIGQADEKNCEQMFGAIPVPVGLAGPLTFTFSSNEERTVYLPLATTEGALVASVNRGCKILSPSNLTITSTYHGMTRSIAFKIPAPSVRSPFTEDIHKSQIHWQAAAEATSNHLKLLGYDIDAKDEYVFLTIACDTDEAMGMNMATIAAQAAGQWIIENLQQHNPIFVTVAGNVDSDKKPSRRTHDRGRGYDVTAAAEISADLLASVLKTTPEAMLQTADAKLNAGSEIAGAIGQNLHAANIVAALFIATGQDAAHVVEGSLADTTVTAAGTSLRISTRLPALCLGIRGGGTTLPAQAQCLRILLQPETALHPCMQLAESIGAAVLAGEISLLAAQASHTLAQSHKTLGR